jgi:hypothetical protein
MYIYVYIYVYIYCISSPFQNLVLSGILGPLHEKYVNIRLVHIYRWGTSTYVQFNSSSV